MTDIGRCDLSEGGYILGYTYLGSVYLLLN